MFNFGQIKESLKVKLANDKIVNLLWYSIPLIGALIKSLNGRCTNNYQIYKYVYLHTLDKTDLYAHYPSHHWDVNHYGIVYGLLIAPFTYLPDMVAIVLYQALQLFCLNWVIRKLPLSTLKQNILLVFLLFEALANAQNIQTNIFIAFVMLAAYVAILNKKEVLSTVWILLGFFVKIYGIVGLGLFFFVKDKSKFIVSFVIVAALFYFAPLLITDIGFIQSSYASWYTELVVKNGTNIDLSNTHQNMSAIGIIVKALHNNSFSMLYIVFPVFLLQLLPLIRYSLFSTVEFQLKYLCTLLLFIVLYSTGTEASTHIIGAIGVGIWWLLSPNYQSKKMLWFIAFCFFLGTLSTTDLVPRWFNFEIVRRYSLKALPYWIVWFVCLYQLLFDKFLPNDKNQLQKA